MYRLEMKKKEAIGVREKLDRTVNELNCCLKKSKYQHNDWNMSETKIPAKLKIGGKKKWNKLLTLWIGRSRNEPKNSEKTF